MSDYFDATVIKPYEDFEPIPAGEYLLVAVGSEVKDSQKGGRYYNFTLEVVEGEYKGRKIWDIFSIEGSEKAVQIGKARLSSLCAAVGKLGFKTTSELHGRPVPAKVGIQPEQNGYPAKNVIKSYLWKKTKVKPDLSDDSVPF
jgi:hypothetical protein